MKTPSEIRGRIHSEILEKNSNGIPGVISGYKSEEILSGIPGCICKRIRDSLEDTVMEFLEKILGDSLRKLYS